MITLTLDKIFRNRDQPRRQFNIDDLVDLARSIHSTGLVQPIVVQPAAGPDCDEYLIVDGERRWRASLGLAVANHRAPGDAAALIQFITNAVESLGPFLSAHRPLLAQTPINVVITNPAADTKLLIKATVANLHRADLNPIEIAAAYQTMADNGLTDDDIAQAVGKSRSGVANLRRLTKLPEDMKLAIAAGHISTRVALAYLPVLDIKPHLLGDANLDNNPSFNVHRTPTPTALRKRLCHPDKYGAHSVKLTSDTVRQIVDDIIKRCTPVPCPLCQTDTRKTGMRLDGGKKICPQCYQTAKAIERHTRYCRFCGHGQSLTGLEIDVYQGGQHVQCQKCNKSWSGYGWRTEPRQEYEYRPLVLTGEPAGLSPRAEPAEAPPAELVEAKPVEAWTKIENGYAVLPCHVCQEKKIKINPGADKVECEACGNAWDSLAEYHSDRKSFIQDDPIARPVTCVQCGRPLSLNDTGLGYTTCRPCESELSNKLIERLNKLVYAIIDSSSPQTYWRLSDLDVLLDQIEANLVCAQTEEAQ